MRTVFLILILAVLALIAAVATGWLDIRQTRSAELPEVEASSNGITATGGQTPAFDVETGTVAVGTEPRDVTVPVPTVEVQPPANSGAQGNQAVPAE